MVFCWIGKKNHAIYNNYLVGKQKLFCWFLHGITFCFKNVILAIIMCSDKQVSIKCWLLQMFYHKMNKNWRREFPGRLFLHFVQTMTVRMEKFKIGNEQKLHEGHPRLAEPLHPSCHFFITIWLNPPSLLEKDVLFEWPHTYLVYKKWLF